MRTEQDRCGGCDMRRAVRVVRARIYPVGARRGGARRADALARYGGDQVEVCVAKRDIAAGETVDSGAIETRLWVADLLPPELQWGYSDNLILSEKRQVYQAMAQFMLINLDEFNQISPQVQQGFLKILSSYLR